MTKVTDSTKIGKKAISSQRETEAAGSQALGLSSDSHLTAPETPIYVQKKFQNGEGQIFVRLPKEENGSKKSGGKGRPEGEIVQEGLTSRGKRTLRLISDAYEHKHANAARFITLTFRQHIPDDKQAKRLLDNFFKRLVRLKGTNVHYCWVAEIQTKRLEASGTRAIHFHILTPERLGANKLEEIEWINRAWNEVNANWAFKSGRIDQRQFDNWKDEFRRQEKYNRLLWDYKGGKRSQEPRKPAKSTYLLLPNLSMVNNAGRYMAKYMSKQGQSIVGGLYGASMKSRDYLEYEEKMIAPIGQIEDPGIVLQEVAKIAQAAKIKTFAKNIYANCYSIWSDNIEAVKEIWENHQYELDEISYLAFKKKMSEQARPEEKPRPFNAVLKPQRIREVDTEWCDFD